MMDMVVKITLWAIIYGALCFGFGIWLGSKLKAVSSEDEESLLEWPPYEKHL